MTVPNVAGSVTIAEYTDTVGTNDYRLLGALSGSFRFRDEHDDGDTIEYFVLDGPNVEVTTGILTYGSPDMLSRDTIQASSNNGSKVNWSGITRPIIREIANNPDSITICSTPATDGQDLVWDGVNNEWCPDQRVIGSNAVGGSGLAGRTASIAGGDGDGVGAGGQVLINGGTGGGTSGRGGHLDFEAGVGGSPSGQGGLVFIGAGEGIGAGRGGDLDIEAGFGGSSGRGGDVFQFAGDGNSTSRGGHFEIFAGDATGTDGDGGDILMFAGTAFGNSNGRGGDVQIFGGRSFTSSNINGGDIFIFAGETDSTIAKGGVVEIDGGIGGNGGDIILGPGNSHSGAGKIGVIWLYDSSPIVGLPPTTNPTVGYYIYIDTTDGNKLKIRGASGTIATLAVP